MIGSPLLSCCFWGQPARRRRASGQVKCCDKFAFYKFVPIMNITTVENSCNINYYWINMVSPSPKQPKDCIREVPSEEMISSASCWEEWLKEIKKNTLRVSQKGPSKCPLINSITDGIGLLLMSTSSMTSSSSSVIKVSEGPSKNFFILIKNRKLIYGPLEIHLQVVAHIFQSVIDSSWGYVLICIFLLRCWLPHEMFWTLIDGIINWWKFLSKWFHK